MEDYITNSRFKGIVSKKEFLEINTLLDSSNSPNSPYNKKEIALISIHDPKGEPHSDNIVDGYSDSIQSYFWDLQEKFVDKDIISDSSAKELYDFIIKNKDSVFLIHCSAGKSRSAGVGRAIECLLEYDGKIYDYMTSNSEELRVTDYKRYSPNRIVFDKIVGNK